MITLDIITLVLMLATFIVLLTVVKLPSGVSLMAASVVGLISGCIINNMSFDVRYLIEGGFGYIDNLLVIVCAMVFIKGLQASGGLDYLTAFLVKAFRKFPTILLLIFMVLLLAPGMVTGSSTAAVVSIGIIVTPILIGMGMPKAKAAGFVGMGAILGMVAPPINIPVMVICDVVDISYSGFDIPLLLLTIPMAVFTCIFFSRSLNAKKELANNTNTKQVNVLENIILTAFIVVVEVFFVILLLNKKTSGTANEIKLYTAYLILISVVGVLCTVLIWLFKPYCAAINVEEINKKINMEVVNKVNICSLIPLFVIVVLFALQSLIPLVMGKLGTPILFIIAFIPTLFTGIKFKAVKAVDEAVEKCIGVLGLLMGVGMFVEVLTAVGPRGLIVANILTLLTVSKPVLYLAMALSLAIFGGISSFASASVFGGPFVMALYGKLGYIIVASACSLIAALGEFLPPTAISSRLAVKNINDLEGIEEGKNENALGFMACTKNAAIPLALTLLWAMAFVIICGPYTA